MSPRVSCHSRQGFGSVLMLVLITVLVTTTVLGSYAASQLLFSTHSDREVRAERTDDHLSDTAAWLHSWDGARVLNSDTTRITVLQETPVRRCLVVDYSAGALRSKQRRLGPTEPPTGVCESNERHVLDANVAPTTFVWRDASGGEASPSAAKSVEFTLADPAAPPTVKPVFVKLRING